MRLLIQYCIPNNPIETQAVLCDAFVFLEFISHWTSAARKYTIEQKFSGTATAAAHIGAALVKRDEETGRLDLIKFSLHSRGRDVCCSFVYSFNHVREWCVECNFVVFSSSHVARPGDCCTGFLLRENRIRQHSMQSGSLYKYPLTQHTRDVICLHGCFNCFRRCERFFSGIVAARCRRRDAGSGEFVGVVAHRVS